MIAPVLQDVVQALTGRLLNTAAEGILLAALVWLLLRLIGRQNSGTRFAVWFSALIAVVALPFAAGTSRAASGLPGLPVSNLRGEITLPASWAFYLFAAWALGAGALLLRLTVGLWRVRALRKSCSEVSLAGLDPTMAAVLRDQAAGRGVRLCTSNEVAVPAAFGFLRPAIVFPAWLLPQLSAEEFKVILLHELAHLRRWDDWTNLAQKILKAVFFFHPAVWWIERRLTLEREMACDDMVLAQTASPRAYAASLISFAEKLQHARGLALAQAIVSRMREMSLRVAQILDGNRPIRTALWKPVAVVGAGMLAVIFAAAPYVPQVVAFNEPESNVARAKPGSVSAIVAPHQPQVVQAALSSREAVSTPRLTPRGGGLPQVSSQPPQPKIIPASFKPRRPIVPLRLKATSSRGPTITRAEAKREQLPLQTTTLVLLQRAGYDASGSPVWTVCIWRFGAQNSAEKQLESAIVFSLI